MLILCFLSEPFQEDCLTSFFQHQELRGINCCFCPNCETKTPSNQVRLSSSRTLGAIDQRTNVSACPPQAVKVLSLPRILCMNLKRFRSSHRGTQKLDCSVTFPETFDFSETAGGAFSPHFAPVMLRPVSYPYIFFFLSYGANRFVSCSRVSAGTLCMQWWCTLATPCADITPPSSATQSLSSGTTPTTAA